MPSSSEPPPLPLGFRFGVATADHQCEAYVTGLEDIRDEWERVRGLQRRLQATDFWTRYSQDIDLAASLGCKMFRISLSWARLEPSRGAWDPVVERHYASLLQVARVAGMKTIVSLHHNTWPLHVQRTGDGMLDDGFPDLLAAYARRVAQTLGNDIDYYVTINEPNQLIFGYIKGFWMRAYPMPPGLDAFASETEQMQRVIRLIPNLFKAHARAREAIRTVRPGAMVGSNPLILGVPQWLRACMDWHVTRVKRPDDLLAQAGLLSQPSFVSSGDVDFSIAQLTMTQARMDKVLFSEPYFVGHLVAMHEASTVLPPSFETWSGRVGVTQQTAPAAMAETSFPNAAITEYKDTAATVAGLNKHEIDLIFDDDAMLRQFEGAGLIMTPLPAPDQPFAIATTLGSRTLLNAVDLALRKFKDGSVGQSLWQQAVAQDFPALAQAGAPDIDNRKTLANIGGPSPPMPEPSEVPDMDRSLDTVCRRGKVRVGIHPGVNGLCVKDATGNYEGLEPTIARYIAGQILNTPSPVVDFVPLVGDRRVDAARSWFSFFDPLRKIVSLIFSFVGANWWNLGMAGRLPEFLCPAECVGTLDFVGLDYYWGTDSIWQAHRLVPAMECRYGDAPVWPRGLYNLLRSESERFPGKPLLIIENGCVPVADGVSCADYLTSHVREAQRAVAHGVPLEAYVCWTITSNREWGLVFDHNSDFGLYHIDLDRDATLTRTPTGAAIRYAQIIAKRSA
jgi:beta-glucosidase/6-phospho-beta-glucosidase/beta-galactosidase/ABC-type amino acid transport substrate-binding protein